MFMRKFLDSIIRIVLPQVVKSKDLDVWYIFSPSFLPCIDLLKMYIKDDNVFDYDR